MPYRNQGSDHSSGLAPSQSDGRIPCGGYGCPCGGCSHCSHGGTLTPFSSQSSISTQINSSHVPANDQNIHPVLLQAGSVFQPTGSAPETYHGHGPLLENYELLDTSVGWGGVAQEAFASGNQYVPGYPTIHIEPSDEVTDGPAAQQPEFSSGPFREIRPASVGRSQGTMSLADDTEPESAVSGGVSCDECGKRFTRRTDLKRHTAQTHQQEERKHICDECGQAFYWNKDVQRHKLTHSDGIEQYRCTVRGCNKKYSRKDNLTRHLRTRHYI